MIFEYQKTQQFFAQITDETKGLALRELSALKASKTEIAKRGIYFEADHAALYRINYASRFITRVHAPLLKFPCHSTKYLYKKCKEIPWTQIFSEDHTFAIFSNVSNSNITHSQYAALVLKDAIVDNFRDVRGRRPNVERINPDVFINLHINHNHATISLETSGGSMHRRGYRQDSLEAPMQETVAAAVIQFSQWDGKKRLYDPMCGAGTLLCEALMKYCRIPSGYLRKQFGFQFLPDFDKRIWTSVRKEMDDNIRELPESLIFGSDMSQKAIEASGANLKNIPSGANIALNKMDIRKMDKIDNAIVVINPPYGVRLGESRDMAALYRHIESFLREKCADVEAYIYFGDKALIRKIGLKPSWKKPLKNGGLDGRLVKYLLPS